MPVTSANLDPARPWAVGARDPVTRHGLVGLLGSTVLAVGALGVGHVPARSRLGVLTATDVLRTTTVGGGIAKVCVIVGALLLLRAWLLLGADVREGRITGTARLVRMFWLWAVPLVLVPPLFSQDVYSYTAQGNLLNVGYDPYKFGPAAVPGANLATVSGTWLDTPAPYGPSFLYLGKLTAQLFGSHIYLAALTMRLLALLGVWLIATYLPRLARACGKEPSLAVWAGLLNPLVLMHFVSGAHNDALMTGLVVAGLAYALEGQPIIGALLVTLGGTVKAPALLALGFVGLAWAMRRDGSGVRGSPDEINEHPRRRARIGPWIAVASIALATFLVINALTGLTFGWIGALGTPGLIHTWLSPVTAVTLTVAQLIAVAGLGDHGETMLRVARIFCEVGILALIATWLLRRRAIEPATGTAAALLLLAVFGPVLQPWYVLWGLIVISAAALGRRGMPYVAATTATLVVYCTAQTSSTTDPLIHIGDGICAALGVAVGATMLLRDPVTRTEIGHGIRGWRSAARRAVLPQSSP